MRKPLAFSTNSRNLIFSSFNLTFLMLLTWAIMLSGASVFAANSINIDSSTGLAIHGYDPVAYFTESKAVEGKPEFTIEYLGNKWAFSSHKNKQAFLKDPEAYIPQYGGHCAFAASKNAIANTDPFAWIIHNKKLYLNYSFGTRELWLKNRDANIVAANGFWPTLSKRIP